MTNQPCGSSGEGKKVKVHRHRFSIMPVGKPDECACGMTRIEAVESSLPPKLYMDAAEKFLEDSGQCSCNHCCITRSRWLMGGAKPKKVRS